MKLIHALKKAIGVTLADRIDSAITRASNLSAEADKYKMRELFYDQALRHVDPHEEWNLFAHLKQKQYDARQEYNAAQMKFAVANDRARKLIDENISPFHTHQELLTVKP